MADEAGAEEYGSLLRVPCSDVGGGRLATHRLEQMGRRPVDAAVQNDGWTLITRAQSELGHRYLEIMREMNPATYSPADPARYVKRMWRPPNAYYHFAGATFELVVGFDWIRRLRRFRIISTGFVGAITPIEALDRVAIKAREFLLKYSLDHFVAIRPRRMENSRILEFYDLLNQHPALRVRRGHWLVEGEYLWIRFR